MILNGKVTTTEQELLTLALHGQGCFTTMLWQRGRVRGLQMHLQRLLNDARQLFAIELDVQRVVQDISVFVSHARVNGGDTDKLIIRVTVFPADFNFAKPEQSSKLNILVTGRAPQITGRPNALRLQCVAGQTALPQHKTVNMLAYLKARKTARQAGYDDALLAAQGAITEGPTWNVFFITEQTLLTPALDLGLLPGVTRALLIANTPPGQCQERRIKIDDIRHFKAAFITNAGVGIQPIHAVNDYVFPEPGAVQSYIDLLDSIPGDRILPDH